MAPSYICDLLHVHQPNRNLRSASRGLSLVVPPYQTQAYGARSFSVVAPTLWNSLPVVLKMRNLCLFFKKSLKHFYLINFTPSLDCKTAVFLRTRAHVDLQRSPTTG